MSTGAGRESKKRGMSDLVLLTLGAWEWWAIIVGMPAMFMMLLLLQFVSRYKRCPSNRLLVVHGRVGKGLTCKVFHGGGVLVTPVTQDYEYMSLEPITVKFKLANAMYAVADDSDLEVQVIVAIPLRPDIMQHAAERLLGMPEKDIAVLAREILLTQAYELWSPLGIEEFEEHRHEQIERLKKNANHTLHGIGLEIVNVLVPLLLEHESAIQNA